MPNVAQNLLQYTTNAMTAYGSNNAAIGLTPAGWTAVEVRQFDAKTTGFAGQLMTDGQGNYRISMRGKNGVRVQLILILISIFSNATAQRPMRQQGRTMWTLWPILSRTALAITKGLALSGLVCTAALAQDPGKHALDYTYAEGSPQYWRGMHSTRPGNYVFRKDPHVWVVTPDFAKKAGLPLEWASEELQGVTAAAWRMQPGEEQCGWGGNPNACKRDMVCTLDLYFDRQTQALPWAPNRPVADFDWQKVSSAWHLLPSLGWGKEANGDLARGTKGSPNYPGLDKSPFADPKTGDELLWNTSVIAYDREIHGRYAFLRLSLGCMGQLGSEPHESRKFRLETKTSRSERYSDMGRSTERPDLAKFVYYSIALPASWDKRIGPFRKAIMQGTENFYQSTWNTINKGDTK